MTFRETVGAMIGSYLLVVAFLAACAGAVAIAGVLQIHLGWVAGAIALGFALMIFG